MPDETQNPNGGNEQGPIQLLQEEGFDASIPTTSGPTTTGDKLAVWIDAGIEKLIEEVEAVNVSEWNIARLQALTSIRKSLLDMALIAEKIDTVHALGQRPSFDIADLLGHIPNAD